MDTTLDLLFLLLRPLGGLYALLMRFRAYLYRREILSRYSSRAAVISVGNLTMGGAGKTPMVIYLARFLQGRGYAPAVISRGYRGKANAPVNVVSNCTGILLASDMAGDEPRLLAEALPGTPVLTGKKRQYPCQVAVERLGRDLLILDDGFQHMRVKRDLDIVLFSASSLRRRLHVFPGGLLREPFSALTRADCVVITGCSGEYRSEVERFRAFLAGHWPQTPVFSSLSRPKCFAGREGETIPLETDLGPVLAFCGIADPSRFRGSIEHLGLALRAFHSFPDHADYPPKVLADLAEQARRCGARTLLTTEKDLVKLQGARFDAPLLALRLQMEMDAGFEEFLLSRLASSGGR